MNSLMNSAPQHITATVDENEVAKMRDTRAALRCQYIQAAAKCHFLEVVEQATATDELRPDVEVLDAVYGEMDSCNRKKAELDKAAVLEMKKLNVEAEKLAGSQQKYKELVKELADRKQEIERWKLQPVDSLTDQRDELDATRAIQFVRGIPGVTILAGDRRGTFFIDFGRALTLRVVQRRGARSWLLSEATVHRPGRPAFLVQDLVSYCIQINSIPLLVSEVLVRIANHQRLLDEMAQISAAGHALCALHQQRQGVVLVTLFSGVSCTIEVSAEYPAAAGVYPRLSKIDTMGLYSVDLASLVEYLGSVSLKEMVQALEAKFPAPKKGQKRK